MAALYETVVVPREAPVYSADGAKLGMVNGVGTQCLRIRQGRFIARYLDVPVHFVDRVEHGRVWLNEGLNAVLTVARTVANATAPDAAIEPATAQAIAAD